ncbi:MAG: hypothetical protein AB2A00_15155 [Myxococcota bacterium]
MKHAAVALSVCVALGCRPPPPPERPDAGMAQLKGVVFERIRGDHKVLRMEAPTAELDIDGTRVTLNNLTGEAQERPDAGRYTLQAARVVANLEANTFVVEQARAHDDNNRQLSSPRLYFSPDGGVAVAEPPVTLEGPNFELRSEQGARADLASEELELVGPVEAHVWPVGDAGAAHSAPR